MIVVDTTAWVDHLRDRDLPHVRRLRDVILNKRGTIIVGDLILCEVLQGLGDERQSASVERALRRFDLWTISNPALAVAAAANYRALRSLGITVRKTIDMLIGTFCLAGGHALLHNDRDFDHLERHLGLVVLR